MEKSNKLAKQSRNTFDTQQQVIADLRKENDHLSQSLHSSLVNSRQSTVAPPTPTSIVVPSPINSEQQQWTNRILLNRTDLKHLKENNYYNNDKIIKNSKRSEYQMIEHFLFNQKHNKDKSMELYSLQKYNYEKQNALFTTLRNIEINNKRLIYDDACKLLKESEKFKPPQIEDSSDEFESIEETTIDSTN